jgi:predicted ABC-class ATPase
MCAHAILGRTILGHSAAEIFRSEVPRLAEKLFYSVHDQQLLKDFILSIEDQESLRRQITEAGEQCLQSRREVTGPNEPLGFAQGFPLSWPTVLHCHARAVFLMYRFQDRAVVRFMSPPNLERLFGLPSKRGILGMAIPQGITLVAGGGFHVSLSDKASNTLVRA